VLIGHHSLIKNLCSRDDGMNFIGLHHSSA
jgi:hypothetical protein